MPRVRPRASIVPSETIRSGSSNGSQRIRSALTSVKTGVLTPIPSASATAATAVNHRSLIRRRVANRKSCQRFMATAPRTSAEDPEWRSLDRGHFHWLLDNAAIKQMNVALRVSRIPWIVSDHADGRAILMELVEELHHCFAALRVE